jgi:sirohydrochlorin ferrochelatase
MPERPVGSHQVLVAVAHGSADPRAAVTITDLMAVAAERAAARGLSLPEVRAAYLGHAAPSLPQVMGAIGRARVTVLPLLLTAAYHSKTDVPRVLARVSGEFPRLQVSYGATLGPHPLLLSALERRLAEADPLGPADPARRAQTGVVLAAAGSTDPEANATITRLAAQWQARAGWFAVRPASAAATPGPPIPRAQALGAPTSGAPTSGAPTSGAPTSGAPTSGAPTSGAPTPAEAVTGLLRAGARRVLVATYLLAPGLFADRIRATALAAGAAAVSPALGASPEVAEVLLDRYQEAGSVRRTAA